MRFEVSVCRYVLPPMVAFGLLVPSLGCDELGPLFEEDAAAPAAPAEPAPAEPDAVAEEPSPERPADSIARSQENVITFQSILDNSDMSRAERIRAFENLDPGALQKRVAQPNVSGAPKVSARTRRPSTSADTSPSTRKSRPDVPIVMFSTSWCGVCKRARQYFREQGIPFTEYDVDENLQARNEYLLLNPRRTVPTIKIADRVVVGFSPASVEAAIQAAAP